MASISNNSNIPLSSKQTFNGLYEQLSSGIESIQVSIKSNEPGIFRVFFAQTPTVLLYEKSYTYDPTTNPYFFVSIPRISQYYRCSFTNTSLLHQSYFELRTTFNNYLLLDEPTNGSGSIVQVSNFPANQVVSGSVSVSGTVDTSGSSVSVSNFPTIQDVSDSTTHGALGSVLAELISINNEILNPTSIQVITGTIFSQGEGSPDGGTTWEPIKTTAGVQNVIIDSGSVSVSGTVDTSGSSVEVSNFPLNQVVSGTMDTHLYAYCDTHTTWEPLLVNSSASHQKLMIVDEDCLNELKKNTSNLSQINSNIATIRNNSISIEQKVANLEYYTITNSTQILRSLGNCYYGFTSRAYTDGGGAMLYLYNNEPTKTYYLYNVAVSYPGSSNGTRVKIAMNYFYEPTSINASGSAIAYHNLKLDTTSYNNLNLNNQKLGRFLSGGILSNASGSAITTRNIDFFASKIDGTTDIRDYQEENIQIPYKFGVVFNYNLESTPSNTADVWLSIRWYERTV